MDDKRPRFPAVLRIDPIPSGLRVGYVAVAESGQHFTRHHTQAVGEALQSKLTRTKRLRVSTGVVEGFARLSVHVEPSDSLVGSGNFPVLATLQELFQPRVSHVAVATLLSPVGQQGDLLMNMRILGHPDDYTIQGIESRIRLTPRTVQVWHAVKNNRHFTIQATGMKTAQDVWEKEAQKYQEELIELAGISYTLVVSGI